jgi:hypothetical protein
MEGVRKREKCRVGSRIILLTYSKLVICRRRRGRIIGKKERCRYGGKKGRKETCKPMIPCRKSEVASNCAVLLQISKTRHGDNSAGEGYSPNSKVLVVVIIRHGHIDCCFVDPSILGQFSVLFQVTCLVGRVFVHDVDLLILEVTFPYQNDVTSGDPYLLSHLSSDVSKAGDTVKTEALAPAVAKHLDYLRVLLSVFLEF